MSFVVRVTCDDCGLQFPLQSPDCIVECRTFNEQDQEIRPREFVAFCPKCFAVKELFDDED